MAFPVGDDAYAFTPMPVLLSLRPNTPSARPVNDVA